MVVIDPLDEVPLLETVCSPVAEVAVYVPDLVGETPFLIVDGCAAAGLDALMPGLVALGLERVMLGFGTVTLGFMVGFGTEILGFGAVMVGLGTVIVGLGTEILGLGTEMLGLGTLIVGGAARTGVLAPIRTMPTAATPASPEAIAAVRTLQ